MGQAKNHGGPTHLCLLDGVEKCPHYDGNALYQSYYCMVACA